MADHYETLGVARDADGKEIRRAFSRLAKELHPDRNPDPKATDQFMAVKTAYDVLSDPERRKNHDAVIRLNEEIERRKQDEERERIRVERAAAEAEAASKNSAVAEKEQWVATKERMEKLARLLNTNRLADAETLAGDILSGDPRNPVAYAAKGDIARIRGDLVSAQKFYAYAVQYDSRNAVYQRKFEEVVAGAEKASEKRVRFESEVRPAAMPGAVATFIVLIGMGYTVLANEPALFTGFGLANTLTLGQLVMLLVSGVTVGACLTASGVMDPIDASLGSAVVKVPPAIVLGFVAVVNFWLALGLYLLVGMSQGAMNRSLSRLLGYSGLVTFGFALFKVFDGGLTPFWQTFLWGGNLVYVGAACGWFVADSLKRV